jgi:hypothetical protein
VVGEPLSDHLTCSPALLSALYSLLSAAKPPPLCFLDSTHPHAETAHVHQQRDRSANHTSRGHPLARQSASGVLDPASRDETQDQCHQRHDRYEEAQNPQHHSRDRHRVRLAALDHIRSRGRLLSRAVTWRRRSHTSTQRPATPSTKARLLAIAISVEKRAVGTLKTHAAKSRYDGLCPPRMPKTSRQQQSAEPSLLVQVNNRWRSPPYSIFRQSPPHLDHSDSSTATVADMPKRLAPASIIASAV